MAEGRKPEQGRGRRRIREPFAKNEDWDDDDVSVDTKGTEKSSYIPPIVSFESMQESISTRDDESDRRWLSQETALSTGLSDYSTIKSDASMTEFTGQSVSKSYSRDTSVLSPHRHPPAVENIEQDEEFKTSFSDDSGKLRAREYSRWLKAEEVLMKRKWPILSIGLSAVQLLVLVLQLLICGVAPLEVNPIVGPYPDAFSYWGGKNAYLLVEEMQLFRLVTPAFLHVGILHLLCNAAFQLESGSHFEREWGSSRWFLIYIVSEVGCVVFSCIIEPETIAVGSSGALAGLFGAKLAQYTISYLAEVSEDAEYGVNPTQLLGTLCIFTLVMLMSAFSYVDWSGHVGGLITGFFLGLLLLCSAPRSICARVACFATGLSALSGGFFFATTCLYSEVELYEELADPCQYFRTLFAEGYDCQCMWA